MRFRTQGPWTGPCLLGCCYKGLKVSEAVIACGICHGVSSAAISQVNAAAAPGSPSAWTRDVWNAAHAGSCQWSKSCSSRYGRKYILKHSSRCMHPPNSRRTRRRMRWWIVYNENPNRAAPYFHAAEKSSCKDGGEDYGTTTSCQPEPSFQVMQATMLVVNNLSPETPKFV